MDNASDALLSKNGNVPLHSDNTAHPSLGGCEKVETVNADLVVRDTKGELYSVRYDSVNAMLLNEYLKEHRRVEELKSAMASSERISRRPSFSSGKHRGSRRALEWAGSAHSERQCSDWKE